MARPAPHRKVRLMKRFTYSLLLVLVSLAVFVTVPAFAQQDSVINVHVDKAVAIPGYVLLPGDYVFRLADTNSYPDFVEISTADGSRTFGFIRVFEAKREHASGDKMIISQPDAAGLQRIKSWYFPGETYGYRFIYSKGDLRKADMIAQQMRTKENAGL